MVASTVGAAQARIDLRAGRPARAAEWAAAYQQAPPALYQRDDEDLTLACVLFAQGDCDAVLAWLAQMIEQAQGAGRMRSVIVGEILRGLAWQAAGKLHAALDACELALQLAQPHGYVRVFLDMGAPMLRLLRHAQSLDGVSAYARHLLDIAFAADAAAPIASPLPPTDTLSEQERKVLQLLCAGMSNQDIARELVITPGTAKWHVHNVLQKLDVRSRGQAIVRAHELGLV
jgi:LuxR family maltose regulon positive regulatory protein